MDTTSFRIRQSTLKTGGQELRQYRNILRSVGSSVGEAARIMNGMHGHAAISSSLFRIQNRSYRYAETADSMARALEDIVGWYGNTEKILTDRFGKQTEDRMESGRGKIDSDKGILSGFWEWICRLLGLGERNSGSTTIDSVVFDDSGLYGGDQGRPRLVTGENKERLYDIVRSHFPNMANDKMIDEFLRKLNSEGCAYVATINTIFAAYEGREEEFEKIFGMPMYRDGDLNFDELLVDFYCSTDNHNSNEKGVDYVDQSEDPSHEKGSGMNPSQQIYRSQRYFQEKGVPVHISFREVTVKDFEKYSHEGYVVLDYYDGPLEYRNGKTVQDIKGGHAMTITGVTDDGRFVVSSWGKQYYVDPSKGRCHYVYFKYE